MCLCVRLRELLRINVLASRLKIASGFISDYQETACQYWIHVQKKASTLMIFIHLWFSIVGSMHMLVLLIFLPFGATDITKTTPQSVYNTMHQAKFSCNQ